jgi:hypothetical protein
MKREHLNGLYRIDVYFMARQLADLPLFFLTPVIFMSIFYFMAMPDNGVERFLMTTLITIIIVQVKTIDFWHTAITYNYNKFKMISKN